jgi:hypothetical protein
VEAALGVDVGQLDGDVALETSPVHFTIWR